MLCSDRGDKIAKFCGKLKFLSITQGKLNNKENIEVTKFIIEIFGVKMRTTQCGQGLLGIYNGNDISRDILMARLAQRDQIYNQL